jgi:hypothetical protein
MPQPQPTTKRLRHSTSPLLPAALFPNTLLFSRLGEDDERFHHEVSADGILFDNTEPPSRSFKGRWIGATLEEMRVIGEAAFDNQKI